MDNNVKKNIELVKQESAKLYQEIIDNGYSVELAKQISDDLATKGGYLFNKSHSYSYAVLCLQTAYLKCHYEPEFLTAVLNNRITTKIYDKKDSIIRFRRVG